LYAGPILPNILKDIAPKLELTADYGMLWPICMPIFYLLKYIYNYVGNWGYSIILVTLLIKVAFYWLNAKNYRSMGNLRRLQPRINKLKEVFGDDKQKFGQAVMELYKKEKVNPLGGCLPIIIQLPVFIALYWVLLGSVELRHAPFILWINDLSSKDPYYILPLVMGITMFLQQHLSPKPADPIQAKVMMFIPIIFTGLFLNFPSGLVLYWVVSNILSIIQQWLIIRNISK
jgi:YidC/Oxa1 family membrane protein insertase